jgi:hypothetical protein
VLCWARSTTTCSYAAREEDHEHAIVRLEQLYPFPVDALSRNWTSSRRREVVWCQEEPRNQGAWYWLPSRQHLIRAQVQAQNAAGFPPGFSVAGGWLSTPSTTSSKRASSKTPSVRSRTDNKKNRGERIDADRSSSAATVRVGFRRHAGDPGTRRKAKPSHATRT